MPLFTFYPTNSHGLAPTFESVELGGLSEAQLHARRVLRAHDSAYSVVTCLGGQVIDTLERNPSEARSLFARAV